MWEYFLPNEDVELLPGSLLAITYLLKGGLKRARSLKREYAILLSYSPSTNVEQRLHLLAETFAMNIIYEK